MVRLVALLTALFSLFLNPSPASAWWTHREGSTPAEVLSQAKAWIAGSTPWSDETRGMSVHPLLTALAIKDYEEERGGSLDLALKTALVVGAIEEAYSLKGEQALSYPSVPLTASLHDPDVARDAWTRSENHFFSIDAITGKEYALQSDTPSDWGLIKPTDAIAWVLHDGENACRLVDIEALLSTEDPQDRIDAYECLGHALHVLQDMANPSHVRNDMYLYGLDSYGYYAGQRTLSDLWQAISQTNTTDVFPDIAMNPAEVALVFRALAFVISQAYFSDDTMFAFVHEGVHPPSIKHYEDGEYFRHSLSGARIAFKGNLYHAVRFYAEQENGDAAAAIEAAKPFTKIDAKIADDAFGIMGKASVASGAALIESFVLWEQSLFGSVPFEDPTDTDTTDVDVIITQVDASNAPDEVKVYASVTTQHGEPLEALTAGNFEIVERIGQSEKIVDVASVATSESAGETVSVCLVIDSSGSMGSGPGSSMEGAREAAKLFVDRMKFNDRAAIIDFSSDVTVLQDFTTDHGLLYDAIDAVDPGGGTSLWDAVVEAVAVTETQAGLRSIIALTDGQDTESSASLADATAAGSAASVPVFAIGLGVNAGTEQQLIQLSDGTYAGSNGSGYFAAPSASELQALYDSISNTLKKVYVITWTSSGSHGDLVDVQISATYTCGNGTFTDVFSSNYSVP